jgi:hypothetical protein
MIGERRFVAGLSFPLAEIPGVPRADIPAEAADAAAGAGAFAPPGAARSRLATPLAERIAYKSEVMRPFDELFGRLAL